jgi:hypothetical protein
VRRVGALDLAVKTVAARGGFFKHVFERHAGPSGNCRSPLVDIRS